MVERYAREEMKGLWDLNAKYSAWLEVEKALVRGWNKLGLIPNSDCEKSAKMQNLILRELTKLKQLQNTI